MLKFSYAMGAACVAMSVFAQGALAALLVNGDFESSQLPAGTGQSYTTYAGPLDPQSGVPGWTFSQSRNGTTGQGPANTWSGICNPEGSWEVVIEGQAAFLEGLGWIQQDFSGLAAGTATVSFSAGGSKMNPLLDDPFTVTLDGTQLSFTGATTITAPRTGMTSYVSDIINVAEQATHRLTFSATTADVTAVVLLDNISVNQVAAPEPSSVALIVAGVISLMAYAWRKRR